ncbi:class I SAM-dependent methyltransferase [Longispora sp. NPDC051575]|uniref:class I SAM-dependent methyltransferase n=1 Tax=Longispora sp. NPDC051575 TaxID=3154943 RepID=UPI003420D7AC
MSALTSRDHNVQQYANQGNLAARQSVWEYRTGPAIFDVALDIAGLTGDESVLEVGCGNGHYLRTLRERGHRGPVLGLDYSPGMAAEAGRHASTVVADAQRLPVGTRQCDLVLCMHMLYHVPDVPMAVAELARVLRPGGTVLVATNGLAHCREVMEILRRATELVGVEHRPLWGRESFTSEAAPGFLDPVFGSVVAHPEVEELRIPDVDAVLGYVASLHSTQSYGPDVLAVAERLVREEFDRRGHFALTRSMTVFACNP